MKSVPKESQPRTWQHHTHRTNFFLTLCFIASMLCAQNGENRDLNISKNLDYFNSIFKNIDLYYVDSINPEKTIQAGIRAMLRPLDPYTEFYPEEEAEELKSILTGRHGGIGAPIMLYKNGQIAIAETFENTPAEKFGLKAGDVLLEIDGKSTIGMNVQKAIESLRGKAGSSLIVKVQRPGTKNPIKLKIVRNTIQHPAVMYYGVHEGQTGYICLNSFTGEPSKEFKKAFLDLKKEGITSLVIDLRDNRGGLIDEPVTIANYFLPKGKEIVATRGKDKHLERIYKTTSTPIDTQIPLILLVDNNTASASEILAGALQDFDRAVIIGSRTYGKGLVQVPHDLPYGASLKITTAKYYIPSGRCIQAINYEAHDEEGMGNRIPDSLTSVFHTAAGREVRDGGGILPDIVTAQEEMPTLMYALNSSIDSMKNVFDFATNYYLSHPTIPSAREFSLSNEEYSQFKQQLKERNFNYDLRSEKVLKHLKEILRKERYDEIASNAIQSLEEALAHNLDRDLDLFSKEIKEAIEMEIVKRYYHMKGTFEIALKNDADFKRALEILHSPSEYSSILTPPVQNMARKS